MTHKREHHVNLALLLIMLLCSMVLLIGQCRSANAPIVDDDIIIIEPLPTDDQQTDPVVMKTPVDIDEYRSPIIYPSGIFSEGCVDNLRHGLIDRSAHYYESYVHQCLVAQVHVHFKSRTTYE